MFPRSPLLSAVCLALLATAPPEAVAEPGEPSAEQAGGLELIEVRRIWDQAPHNAFTDPMRFEGHWYCAFREGQGHVSDDGRMRVLRSADGDEWVSVAVFEWDDGDLRDAKLSITADGRLMFNTAVRLLTPEDGHRHRSLTWLSADGLDWSGPHACPTGLGTWRWSVTWHDGHGYSFGYSGRDAGGCLYRTADGKTWRVVRDDVYPDVESYGNETSLVFLDDGTALCLLRRDAGPKTAMLGRSRRPYEEWQWNDLGTRVGGPKMVRLEDGRLLAVVRLYDDGARTSLVWIDAGGHTVTEALRLPSGGDTSYAGVVEHEGVLWISYYSSHEDRTSIYLAKVGVLPEE